MKKGKVRKTNKYYTFWGIMTLAVVIGQLYVGIGYREMTDSIKELIELADLTYHPRPLT